MKQSLSLIKCRNLNICLLILTSEEYSSLNPCLVALSYFCKACPAILKRWWINFPPKEENIDPNVNIQGPFATVNVFCKPVSTWQFISELHELKILLRNLNLSSFSGFSLFLIRFWIKSLNGLTKTFWWIGTWLRLCRNLCLTTQRNLSVWLNVYTAK